MGCCHQHSVNITLLNQLITAFKNLHGIRQILFRPCSAVLFQIGHCRQLQFRSTAVYNILRMVRSHVAQTDNTKSYFVHNKLSSIYPHCTILHHYSLHQSPTAFPATFFRSSAPVSVLPVSIPLVHIRFSGSLPSPNYHNLPSGSQKDWCGKCPAPPAYIYSSCSPTL